MSTLSVRFFDKEYSIPSDVVTYVDLVDFTNEVSDSLMASFRKKIKPNIDAMESDNFMVSEFDNQASKFVRKLLDNDIYNRTANDYLRNNKGYELFLDTKKKVLRQLLSIRTEKLETYRAGVEGAMYRKEASVTGLDFGIISNSFVNHMLYAYMDASKQVKQEQEALKTYNLEIAALDKQAAEYDRQENVYVRDSVIPAMNTVFTFFAYELLDRYISDLVAVDKFDKAALSFVDLERSNDLLKNLELSNNKKAIIENAFVACPFNLAVYMQAMKHDLLDVDSFHTATVFKQDHHILSFLKEHWGQASYPTRFKIDHQCVELWATYTGKTTGELLHELTAQYATGVRKACSRIADMLSNEVICHRVIADISKDVILAGDSICNDKAQEYVGSIINVGVWGQLTEQCGHTDLLEEIKTLFPYAENVQTKKELDAYLVGQLTSKFEEARRDLIEQIRAQQAEEERQQIFESEQKARTKRRVTFGALGAIFLVAIIVAVFSILSSHSTVTSIENHIANNEYEQAFDLLNNSNLSDVKKTKYLKTVTQYMQKQITKDLRSTQVLNVDGAGIYLESNKISYVDENNKTALRYEGRGKILDDIMYANGLIIFVEAFDSWGYDVNYIAIESGKVTTIDTFNEFDKIIKLQDGNMFINSRNSNGMYILFSPYKFMVSEVESFSEIESSQISVYDTDN